MVCPRALTTPFASSYANRTSTTEADTPSNAMKIPTSPLPSVPAFKTASPLHFFFTTFPSPYSSPSSSPRSHRPHPPPPVPPPLPLSLLRLPIFASNPHPNLLKLSSQPVKLPNPHPTPFILLFLLFSSRRDPSCYLVSQLIIWRLLGF